ncbi:Ctr copper transporter [Lactarius sanguifluus]|nr:Ctr copper transporter [Lactarius sanguifluus]
MRSSNISTRMDMMTPYFHFMGGENLFFKSWRPSSNGAMAGASIALVVLAISEVLLFPSVDAFALNASRTLERDLLSSRKSVAKEGDGSPIVQRRRTIPPFVFSQGAARGALYSLQALLSFALMLAVVTFQGAYIISIVIGLGLREILFGRIASA